MSDRDLIKVGAAIAAVLVAVVLLRTFETEVQPPAVAPPRREDPVKMTKRIPVAAPDPAPATAELPPSTRPSPRDADGRSAIARGAAEPIDPGPFDVATPPPIDEPATSVWPATKDGIDGAVAEAMPALLDCYQGWLEVDPDIEGRVVLGFTIAADVADPGQAGAGKVTVVEATTGARAFEACVTSVFSDLQFEPPAEPIEVHYPVLFAPG